MAEYLIQDETLTAISNCAKRIVNSEDDMNVGDILEVMSRTQGTVKTSGAYLAQAFDSNGTVLKSGTYDTGEIFAMPVAPIKEDMTFQGWACTTPLESDFWTFVEDSPIDAGAIYAPNDDKFIIQLNITAANTTMSFDGIHLSVGETIDWGDGTVESITTTVPSHVYSNVGRYRVKISGYVKATTNAGGNDDTYAGYLVPLDWYNPSTIEKVHLPSYFTKIPKRFFNNMTSLTEVTFSNAVATVGIACFDGCTSIECVVLPSSVTEIKSDASSAYAGLFYGCTNLKKVVLPHGLTELPSGIFNGCSSLTENDIVLPKSITNIGSRAFCGCVGLTSIPALPDGVTEISESMFSGCTGLTNMVIPDSITTIGNSAFYNCKSLTSINIPNGVTSIGSFAFGVSNETNNQVTEIIVPSSVTYIGRCAFDYRAIKTLILLSEQVCELDTKISSFSPSWMVSIYGTSIYVPDALVDSYKADECWGLFGDCIKPLSEYEGVI